MTQQRTSPRIHPALLTATPALASIPSSSAQTASAQPINNAKQLAAVQELGTKSQTRYAPDDGFGINRAQRLPGNVGYQNGGGDPPVVALLLQNSARRGAVATSSDDVRAARKMPGAVKRHPTPLRIVWAVSAALVSLLSTATNVLAAAPFPWPAAAGPVVLVSESERLNPVGRDQTLDRIAQLVEDHYVFRTVAQKVAAEIRTWKSDPEVIRAPDERALASILTERLRKVDRHFAVNWAPPSKSELAPEAPGGSPRAPSLSHDNYGFEAVEHLPGNVGYVRMSMFADFDTALTGDKTPAARAAGEAALTLLQSSDAVIFDLRQNHGGSPAMIDLLLSGFFGDEPVLLNRFYERESNQTSDFTTLANFSGRRRPDVPVYVLISGATGSAAEEFAYDLKSLKRGTIVGEPSFGGANPGEDFDVGEGFTVFISTGAAVNPITQANWEGVGVQPDVMVPAEQALNRAYALALETILAQGASDEMHTEVRWALERLQAERQGLRVAPAAASGFLGTYAGNYGDRKVLLEDGQLNYRSGRFPPFKLIPLNNDAFALDGKADTRIRFERDRKGNVVRMVVMGTDGFSSVYTRR